MPTSRFFVATRARTLTLPALASWLFCAGWMTLALATAPHAGAHSPSHVWVVGAAASAAAALTARALVITARANHATSRVELGIAPPAGSSAAGFTTAEFLDARVHCRARTMSAWSPVLPAVLSSVSAAVGATLTGVFTSAVCTAVTFVSCALCAAFALLHHATQPDARHVQRRDAASRARIDAAPASAALETGGDILLRRAGAKHGDADVCARLAAGGFAGTLLDVVEMARAVNAAPAGA